MERPASALGSSDIKNLRACVTAIRNTAQLRSSTSIIRAGKSSLSRSRRRASAGVRSPNRAEAVMLAFAPEIPRDMHGVVYYHDPILISPFQILSALQTAKAPGGSAFRRCGLRGKSISRCDRRAHRVPS
jgi:hypothetical protein